MTSVDIRSGTRGEPPVQLECSRNIHPCISVAQRKPVSRVSARYGNPLQPSVLSSSLGARQALQTPFACEEVRHFRCCSLSVGRDSFEPVEMTDALIGCRLWRNILHQCCSDVNVVEVSNKNQGTAICCTASRSLHGPCSSEHNVLQSMMRTSSSLNGGREKKPFIEHETVELGEALLRTKYEDQRIGKNKTEREDFFSVFSRWCCCSRAVASARASQRKADSCSISSESGRAKKLHFFVSTARQNFRSLLQRIATLSATDDGNPTSKGLGHVEHSFATPLVATRWSAPAIPLRQENEKAPHTQRHPTRARGNVFEKSTSRHFSSWRPQSPDNRWLVDMPRTLDGSPPTAIPDHVCTWCTLLGVVGFADWYRVGMDATFAGFLEEVCAKAGVESAFFLSLFLKRICDLLEVILFLACLLKPPESLQKGRLPQPPVVTQMTLLWLIDLALLALQEPNGESSQPLQAKSEDQQQLSSGKERTHRVAGRWSSKEEEHTLSKGCTGISGRRFEAQERSSNGDVNLMRIHDVTRSSSKGGDMHVQKIKNDCNNYSDLEPLYLLELRSLKKESSRLKKSVEEKKRKLVKAMARRHRLLVYSAHAIKLTGEYHKRRRLLSQLENPLRRLALLRGYGKRCFCLYHNEIARRAANFPVGFKGRSRQWKTAMGGKNLGLDTQPVGHANQVFHSTLRKPQASFRSVYDRYMDRNCHTSLHQGVSREHGAARKDSGFNNSLESRESEFWSSPSQGSQTLSSRSPSRSCQHRRLSISLDGDSISSLRRKSEDVPRIQKNHREIQSVLGEMGDLIEEYLGKASEDGLPHDFGLFYDSVHLGGHSVMPPLNAAAEKQNGWKQKRMLFFIESFTDLVSNGDMSEEQADAQLRNLLPGTSRGCRADRAFTDDTSSGRDQSEGKKTSSETTCGTSTPAGLCGLPPSVVASTASVCPAGTESAGDHQSECVKDSAMREGSERHNRNKTRFLERRLHHSLLGIPSTSLEARPDAGLHWKANSLRSSTAEYLHQVRSSGSCIDKSDALKSRFWKDSSPECGLESCLVAGKMYLPLVGNLNIPCPDDQTVAGKDCRTNIDAVPVLVLLSAADSKQCGASLIEKKKGVCGVSLASVVEEDAKAGCRAEGCLPGSLTAVKWMSCYIRLLDSAPLRDIAEVGKITNDSITNLSLWRARFAQDNQEARGTRGSASEFKEVGRDGIGIGSNPPIRADDVNITQLQRTPCGESADENAPSIILDVYTARSSQEKKNSLLNCAAFGRMSPGGTENNTAEIGSICKPNEFQNPLKIRSLSPSLHVIKRPLLPHGQQEMSDDCIRSASAEHRLTTPAYGSVKDGNTFSGHYDVSEVSPLPAGIVCEQAMHSHVVCTEGAVGAPAEPALREYEHSAAPRAYGVDNSFSTKCVGIGKVGGPDCSQHPGENPPRFDMNDILQEVAKREQSATSLLEVMESIAVTDGNSRERSVKTNVSGSNREKLRNGVYTHLQDCSDSHLGSKEQRAPLQTPLPSDEKLRTALQETVNNDASSAVAATSKRGSKKLARKKREAKPKRKSPASSTNKMGIDEKGKPQKTKSRLEDKSIDTLFKKVTIYSAVEKRSSQNVKRRADGQRKLGTRSRCVNGSGRTADMYDANVGASLFEKL